MKQVGIVGLDTSHAAAFASCVDATERATVAGVWDSETIRDGEYSETFCREYGARQYDTSDGMIDDVDAVMVLSVNWDDHCELALPFLDADVPTLIDKPIAGRIQDLAILSDAASGTPFFGGSAVPYHPQLRSFSVSPDGQALYCAGYDDTFYYGSHLVDTVRRLAGADWTVVRPASDPGQSVDIVFENDTFATLRLDGPEADSTFTFLNIGQEATAVTVGSDEHERNVMYEAYLDGFLETIDGTVDERHRIFDGARLLLAVQTALSEQQTITANSPRIADTHVRGQTFVDSYEPYY